MAVRSKQHQDGGLSAFFERMALIITLVVFSGITLAGFFMTCRIEIDWAAENTERVLFLPGNLPVNLMVLVVALCLILLLLRTDISRNTILVVSGCMVATVIFGGLWFVNNAYATPGADALSLVELCKTILSGDWAKIRSSYYLRTFPFQMGYLWFLEGFSRLFGAENILAIQKINVILVALSNLVIIRLSHLLFHNRRVTLLTALFTWLFIQPIFLTTFIYGNIPGMFFAFLAILCAVKALMGKALYYIPATLAIAAAALLKMNFSIVLIALVIVFLLHAMKTKTALPAIASVVMAAFVLLTGALPQKDYERRAGVSFGEGTPQTAWLVTGFRESSLCPGWYNSYTTTVLMKNDYDQQQTKAQIQEDLAERVAIFASRPQYAASFFGKKLISQWQEPSYQSIWSSAAGTHSHPVSKGVESVYAGRASEVLFTYFTHLMHLIYVSFLIGLVVLIRDRHLPALALPLTLLGAAIYHLLFEAKAQYVLVYIPLMLPIAALGLAFIASLADGRKTRPRKAKR